MLTFQNSDAYSVVEKNLGKEVLEEIKGGTVFKDGDFLPFGDLEEAVRKDVEKVKGSKVVAKGTGVSGWVYEVESGKVRRVV